MASIIKQLLNPTYLRKLTSFHGFQTRNFSSILNPKSEDNPERIVKFCLDSFGPKSRLHHRPFSVAISRLAELNDFEGIRNVIGKLLETRPKLIDEMFITNAITCYEKAGLLDDAFQLFDKMHELRITQNVKSLNALLCGCLSAKKYDEVSRVYLEFPGKYGVKPNLDTYNIVVKSCCESGSSSSCYAVIAEMKRNECKPNVTTFGTLIAGFYKEEKFEEVEKVLKIMKKHKVRNTLAIHNIRIESLCKLKKTKEANALLDEISSRGMKPNSHTYFYLIRGYCWEGKLDDAMNMFDKATSLGVELYSKCYFVLVHYLCKGGDSEVALKVCKMSMEKDWFPNFVTTKLLVEGLANSSKIDEARELVGQMKAKFPKYSNLWIEVEDNLPKLGA